MPLWLEWSLRYVFEEVAHIMVSYNASVVPVIYLKDFIYVPWLHLLVEDLLQEYLDLETV